MNAELIRFIELCLTDGVISDIERKVIFRKAQDLGVPDDECEIILEGMTIERSNLILSSSSSTQLESDGLTITIGSQNWMKKNLDVITYSNGDKIPQVQDKKAWANLKTGAWCYYDDNPSCGKKYGKIYNWYAVNDDRGLAPKGFHIPSQDEWFNLGNYLGGEDIAGSKMKSTYGWNENGNGNDKSDFSALPGGSRNDDGTFSGIGHHAAFWSSTEAMAISSYHRYLFFNKVNLVWGWSNKVGGLSVRCIKD